MWRVWPSIFDAAVPVGATLITHGESVLSPKKNSGKSLSRQIMSMNLCQFMN